MLLSRQFLLFACVGAGGTLAHYAVLIGLVEVARLSPMAGAAAGFVVGGLVNYVLNRTVVFRSDRSHTEALPRFFAIAATGLVWTMLLMAAMTDGLGLPYLLAQAMTTGLLLVWHYLLNRIWTFRPAEQGAA
ncbi:GtrA family protein [Novispirillum itersonii]|uniref:Putative flippase GtrA n=1 Tax=Novispirillum itersonii TaxID=189 RepID=A0A7W9ZHE8_NOVIT|nr:GtrA family protein [Novispirillum itersonii]MBB6210144.1 putative flippase GtrA [Novispirillum itersonii]